MKLLIMQALDLLMIVSCLSDTKAGAVKGKARQSRDFATDSNFQVQHTHAAHSTSAIPSAITPGLLD
ncbi:hypothetical protein GT037_006997 [Alternaria burnsii]|uniref:Uncharacterized protein n=1 Tax=Alternaria burnsii TaxID=1187904 RepID=A0A8H7EEH1_9PLEO|nr:uncharacterized protein GT037_006997 [Alternaria burnsii]KAF7675234.1 hypothetical protein GT037_006997 [Alternaria burnsii]